MLGALAYAIIQGPQYGWDSPKIIGFFALSIAALGSLLAYEPRRPEPLLEFRLFRSVPFASANLVAICAIAATAGFRSFPACSCRTCAATAPSERA